MTAYGKRKSDRKISYCLAGGCRAAFTHLCSVYRKYTLHLEYEVPSVSEFRSRIEKIGKKYPWLVYEENGAILGYAYGGPLFSRAAYQWTVEDSIYIRADAKGRGIGFALLNRLLSILKKQGFCICYSLIVEGNVPSVKMHEKFGFTECGFAANSGYKLGEWHGVLTMEKQLNEFSSLPKPVIPFPELGLSFF